MSVLDPEFVKRVKSYIDSTEGKSGEIKIISAWEFAPGLVVIHDSWNEYDMYFDLEKWEITNKELWGDSVHPPALAELSMGVLSGVGQMPPINSALRAYAMASRNLTSKIDGQEWQIVELEIE